MILENARGFVYCVSSMGVTGQGGSFHKEIMDYLSYVNDLYEKFKTFSVDEISFFKGYNTGIRTAEDIRPMKDVIDGAIVGSHFINLMREHGFEAEAAAEYCRTFKTELNAL